MHQPAPQDSSGLGVSSTSHRVSTRMPAQIEPVAADPPLWDRRPVLKQQWTELAYLHWRYEPSVVQRRLPAGVTVDTFDGSAWVGLIPFEMRNVQLGSTPPVPFFGNFLEINVRTYVTDSLGRRAVWFSLSTCRDRPSWPSPAPCSLFPTVGRKPITNEMATGIDTR